MYLCITRPRKEHHTYHKEEKPVSFARTRPPRRHSEQKQTNRRRWATGLGVVICQRRRAARVAPSAPIIRTVTAAGKASRVPFSISGAYSSIAQVTTIVPTMRTTTMRRRPMCFSSARAVVNTEQFDTCNHPRKAPTYEHSTEVASIKLNPFISTYWFSIFEEFVERDRPGTPLRKRPARQSGSAELEC